MKTQTDIDAWERLTDVVRTGDVLGQHPRDTKDRFWCQGERFGVWLYPGEFLVEDRAGKLFIVGMREA